MMLLEASVELLEARTGTVFVDPPTDEQSDGEQDECQGKNKGKKKEGKEGRNAEKRAHAKVRDVVKLMRLTLDPVNTRTRPLAIYLLREWAERRLRRTVYREEMGFELVSVFDGLIGLVLIEVVSGGGFRVRCKSVARRGAANGLTGTC
jgi:hypothetical protein